MGAADGIAFPVIIVEDKLERRRSEEEALGLSNELDDGSLVVIRWVSTALSLIFVL